MEEEINPLFSDIEHAFSIDNVTKEFFLKYKELFLELQESLDKVKAKDSYVEKEFEEKNISTVDFAKKLLGQIVFIYFLQKKGWLGVGKDDEGRFKEWGTGPKNFLRKLFEKEIVRYDNFFNDILEPLFYEALANDRSADNDFYNSFKCKVPFLNGGLFEPINGYDWAGTEIVLDNAVFEKIFNTFDRFNFTVKEDEPLEKEVAVDPEMLGKVFENLLEVKDRKSKGAFYTPREIVHYMCQQSLINYLETNTSIPRKDIETFIQLGDFALDMIIREQEQIKYDKSYGSEKLTIPKPIKENYKEIDRLLREIKIVDPAVGSGAFPIGMMNEIVKARSILSLYFEEERKDYDLKREAIENCLYGVDIEPSAVDITKLRFWLSLIVDETNIKNIKPLPNLDYKIMCGNSLLEEFEGIKLFDERLLGEVKSKSPIEVEIEGIKEEISQFNESMSSIGFGIVSTEVREKVERLELITKRKKILENRLKREKNARKKDPQVIFDKDFQNRVKKSQVKLRELEKLHNQIFNEQNRNKKRQLKEDVDKIEWELIEETLKEQSNEEAMQKLQQYKKNKSKPFFLWKLYFAEVFQRDNPGFDVVIANPPYGAEINKKDLKIIKEKLFDTNNSNSAALFIDYAKNQWIRSNGTLSYIVPKSLLYSERWFSLVKAMIRNVSVLIDVEKAFERVKLEQAVFVYNKVIKTDSYLARKFLDDRFQYSTIIKNEAALKLKAWICGITKQEYDIIKNLKITTIFLKEISITKRGIGVQKYLSKKGDIKVIGGKNIFRFGVNGFGGLLPDRSIRKYKNKIQFMKQPKIISQDIVAHIQNPQPHIKITSDFDSNGQYIGLDTVQNTILINSDFEYRFILALLNSTFISWYTYKFIYCSAIRTMHFDNYYVSKIIIPKKITKQKPFINLVDQILFITKDDDYLGNPDKQAKVKRLEKEIDQLVYKLYELTPEEIKIVEGFNGEK